MDEQQLEQTLRGAAPPIGAVEARGVLESVTRRRHRRQRHRRIAAGALALVAIALVGTVTAIVTRHDDAPTTQVAAPGAGLRARIVTGDREQVVEPRELGLDREVPGLRAPLLVGPSTLYVASDDAEPANAPGSHVVRVRGTHVVDVTDFKARVLSIAEGEGSRWALTQNHRPTGGSVPDSFLKRIADDGTFDYTQLPLDADPVGPIAAIGGAVWVPVRDGVLQFDTDLKLVRAIPLTSADARWVAQVGDGAFVTDGSTLRGLDPAAGLSTTTAFDAAILGFASNRSDSLVLIPGVNGDLHRSWVVRADTGAPVSVSQVLPYGFLPNGLASSESLMWATGTIDCRLWVGTCPTASDRAPAITRLGDPGKPVTVVLENATEGAVMAWTARDEVVAVSGGQLYTITLR
jgi:hypothetical protein